MDIQIIREVLTNCQKASTILHVDSEWAAGLKIIMDKLPPVRVAPNGTIMEWIKDYKEFEPGHRHISHLFGLYPGTPDCSGDSRIILQQPAKHLNDVYNMVAGILVGAAHGLLISMLACLMEKECYKHLRFSWKKSTLPKFIDNHPPFQSMVTLVGLPELQRCYCKVRME